MSKEQKLIKEEIIKYYEDIDENGKRRICKETTEIKYARGAKNFPQKSYHTEII